MATPIEVPFENLEPGIGYDPRVRSWNFPNPWPGGAWSLRDIIDRPARGHARDPVHAARKPRNWLRTFYEVNRRASERREPFAFVVPAEQKDPLAAAKLLEVLRLGGGEVQRARSSFTVEGRPMRAGSWVVPMAQPYSAFAKMLLEPPALSRHPALPGAPVQRPYDVTAHTLPLLLGVDVTAVPSAFTADLEPVTEAAVAPGAVHGPRRLAGSRPSHGRPRGARTPSPQRACPCAGDRGGSWTGGRHFPAGTLLVARVLTARVSLALARELGISAQGVAVAPPAALVLRAPRVGVYQSWMAAIDEGWTRFVFEQQAGVDYQTLHGPRHPGRRAACALRTPSCCRPSPRTRW